MIRKYSVTFSTEVKKHLEQLEELEQSRGFVAAVELPSRVLLGALGAGPVVLPPELHEYLRAGYEKNINLVSALESATRLTFYVSFFPLTIVDDLLRVDVSFLNGKQELYAFAVHYRPDGTIFSVDKYRDSVNQKRYISSEESRKHFNYGLA